MKSQIINTIRAMLDPRPEALVFREVEGGNTKFEHQGKVYTEAQCLKMPAKRYVFVIRRRKTNEQKQ